MIEIYFVETTCCVMITYIFSGNDKLYDLTSQAHYTLRIDMEDFENNTRYAVYSNFAVASEGDKYKLSLGTFSGTAGDYTTYLYTTTYMYIQVRVYMDCVLCYYVSCWSKQEASPRMYHSFAVFFTRIWIDNVSVENLYVQTCVPK